MWSNKDSNLRRFFGALSSLLIALVMIFIIGNGIIKKADEFDVNSTYTNDEVEQLLNDSVLIGELNKLNITKITLTKLKSSPSCRIATEITLNRMVDGNVLHYSSSDFMDGEVIYHSVTAGGSCMISSVIENIDGHYKFNVKFHQELDPRYSTVALDTVIAKTLIEVINSAIEIAKSADGIYIYVDRVLNQ